MNTQTIVRKGQDAARYTYAALTSPQAQSFYRNTVILTEDVIVTTTQLLTDTAIAIHCTATSPKAISFYRWSGRRVVDDTTTILKTAIDAVSTAVLVTQFLLTFLQRQDYEEIETYQTALPFVPTPKALPPAPKPIALLAPTTEKRETTEDLQPQPQPLIQAPLFKQRSFVNHYRHVPNIDIHTPLPIIKEEVLKRMPKENVKRIGSLKKKSTWIAAWLLVGLQPPKFT